MNDKEVSQFIYFVLAVAVLAFCVGVWLGDSAASEAHQKAMDTLRRNVNQTQPEYVRASTQSCIHTAAQQLQRCEELARSLR